MDLQYGLETPLSVANKEKHPHIPARNVLDRIILGGSDGAIEGLATTSALNGAGVGLGTIALAGFAFAVAGAIAMFFSSYLSRRSELRSLQIDIDREKMEIETEPEEEEGEMRELLKKDGYDVQEIEVILRRLMENKNLFLREMLRRELGVNIEEVRSDPFVWPLFAGTTFLLLALLAVSPYTFPIQRAEALLASVALSLVALFLLGSRALVPRNFNFKAGIESVLVGSLAAGLLYLIGLVVSAF